MTTRNKLVCFQYVEYCNNKTAGFKKIFFTLDLVYFIENNFLPRRNMHHQQKRSKGIYDFIIKKIIHNCFLHQTIERHGKAYRSKDIHIGGQGETGAYHWRDGGEKHVNDPQSIAFLQDATRNKNKSAYEKYSANQQESVSETRCLLFPIGCTQQIIVAGINDSSLKKCAHTMTKYVGVFLHQVI